MITLKFETLTPLHISNGNQLAYNLEYILKDKFVAKLNQSKSSRILAEAEIFDYSKNYKFFEIIKTLEENKDLFNEDSFEYQVYAEDSFLEYIKNEKRDGQKIIQEFINVNGNFYIPGSSIKGMLSTILNRNSDYKPLGINPKSPSRVDRFIITDSEYLNANDFVVDIANRPPAINLMALDPGVLFNSEIRAKGNLDVKELRKCLKSYSLNQMRKAKVIIERFKMIEKKPGGANNYYVFLEKMLDELTLADGEYLVNLGFGGGSYYKLFPNAEIPKFPNPGRNKKKEEAHTSFLVNIDNQQYQLGWCKLTIEEE